jgi:hypothetical protein
VVWDSAQALHNPNQYPSLHTITLDYTCFVGQPIQAGNPACSRLSVGSFRLRTRRRYLLDSELVEAFRDQNRSTTLSALS